MIHLDRGVLDIGLTTIRWGENGILGNCLQHFDLGIPKAVKIRWTWDRRLDLLRRYSRPERDHAAGLSVRSTLRRDLHIDHRWFRQRDFNGVASFRKVELAGLDHIIVILLDGIRVVDVWSCALR